MLDVCTGAGTAESSCSSTPVKKRLDKRVLMEADIHAASPKRRDSQSAVRATRWNVATVHAGESGMCKPLRIHTSANSENVLKVSPAAGTALMPLRLITTVAKDKILRTCCQSN